MSCTLKFLDGGECQAELISWGINEKGMYCVSTHPLPAPAVLESQLLQVGSLAQFTYLLPTSTVIYRNGAPPPGLFVLETGDT